MWQKYFKDLNPDDYQDEKVKRQFKRLRILGDAALDEDKLTKLTTIINERRLPYCQDLSVYQYQL
jgi:hypothetical protein